MAQELNKEERELLQNQLLRGETLKWTGRPIPRYFNLQTVIMVIAALFGMTFFTTFMAMFFEDAEGDETMNLFLGLFCIPFAIAFLAMLSAPLRNHRKMKRILYAISDKRAIICERKAFGKLSLKTFPIARDMVKEFKLKADGSGDLIFGKEMRERHDEHGSTQYAVPVGFTSLPGVREAQDALMAVIEENENTPTD